VAGIQPDDLLDSVVAAVAANKIAADKAERLPGESEPDSRGLRMEMLF